jgi:hypothetical protein
MEFLSRGLSSWPDSLNKKDSNFQLLSRHPKLTTTSNPSLSLVKNTKIKIDKKKNKLNSREREIKS